MIQGFMLKLFLFIQVFRFVYDRKERIYFFLLFLVSLVLLDLLFVILILILMLFNLHPYILYIVVCNLYKSIFIFIMKNTLQKQQADSIQKTANIQKIFSSSLFNQPFKKQSIIYRLKKGNLFRLSKNQQLEKGQKIYEDEKDVYRQWLKQGLFYTISPQQAKEDLMKKSLSMGQTYFYLNTRDILSIKQKQKNYNLPKLKSINEQKIKTNQSYNKQQKIIKNIIQKHQKAEQPSTLTKKYTEKQNQINLPVYNKTKQQKKLLQLSSFHHSVPNKYKVHKKSCYQQKLCKLKTLNDSENFLSYSNFNKQRKMKSDWNHYQQPVRLSPKNNFLRDSTDKQSFSIRAKKQRMSLNHFNTQKNEPIDDLKRVKNLNMTTKPFFKNLIILQKQAGIGCYDQLSYIFSQFPNCQSIVNSSCITLKNKSYQNKIKRIQSKQAKSIYQKQIIDTQNQKSSKIPGFLLKTLYNKESSNSQKEQPKFQKNGKNQ